MNQGQLRFGGNWGFVSWTKVKVEISHHKKQDDDWASVKPLVFVLDEVPEVPKKSRKRGKTAGSTTTSKNFGAFLSLTKIKSSESTLCVAWRCRLLVCNWFLVTQASQVSKILFWHTMHLDFCKGWTAAVPPTAPKWSHRSDLACAWIRLLTWVKIAFAWCRATKNTLAWCRAAKWLAVSINFWFGGLWCNVNVCFLFLVGCDMVLTFDIFWHCILFHNSNGERSTQRISQSHQRGQIVPLNEWYGCHSLECVFAILQPVGPKLFEKNNLLDFFDFPIVCSTDELRWGQGK